MKLSDAQALVDWSMARHGLTDWKFRLDSAKRRAGCCNYTYRTISLSRHYVLLNPVESIRDTILHEIAHALVGPGHHHNEVWKAKCVEIGAKPVRCYSDATTAMPEPKWLAVCAGCLTEFKRHKRPARNRMVWHGKCGKEKGQLTFTCRKVNFNKNPD